MRIPRRAAWIVFIIAMVIILAVGFYRAARHREPRPESTPASSSSAARTP
jgi:hypothetical protein